MRKNYIVLFVLILIGVAGCAKESKRTAYLFSEGIDGTGCTTGWVQYSSQEDYCAKLVDDNVNNHCAAAIRFQTFQEKCSAIR